MITLKMKHVRHPLRTASIAGSLVARYLDIKRFGDRCSHHFRGDSRYDLKNVSRGLFSHTQDSDDDTGLLARICAAYNKAAQQERLAPAVYQASAWWRRVRQESLGPVIRALQTRDIDSLRGMYRNFFRDPCSKGLVGVPYGMSKTPFGEMIKDMHRRAFLGDALYRIDHWRIQTGGQFPLHELAGPEIGNPFGVLIDGTLVRMGAAYQHYSAQRICGCLNSEIGTVTEIGGGFGGMAYYLLRDRAGVKYIDFDLPESIALTSYYLLKSFPNLKFLLYGESTLTVETLARADVVLMPLIEMERMPSKSTDVVFSSHAMSDISHEAMRAYLKTIARIAKSQFLYIGNSQGTESIVRLTTKNRHLFRLIETLPSGWNKHRHPKAGEMECLYAPVETDAAR
jgi:putative sugar O-methyltransferase